MNELHYIKKSFVLKLRSLTQWYWLELEIEILFVYVYLISVAFCCNHTDIFLIYAGYLAVPLYHILLGLFERQISLWVQCGWWLAFVIKSSTWLVRDNRVTIGLQCETGPTRSGWIKWVCSIKVLNMISLYTIVYYIKMHTLNWFFS